MRFDKAFCKSMGCPRLIDDVAAVIACGSGCDIVCKRLSAIECNKNDNCDKCMNTNWEPEDCVYHLERIMGATG